MTVTEVPVLVPARMLNEFAYCPRLFFLEWVDQLWAPSSDTATKVAAQMLFKHVPRLEPCEFR